MIEGKLIVFSAPSGAGKTTLVKHLLAEGLPLAFSVSACTREPRKDEINGKDYYFISKEEFLEKIAKGEFLEWQEVYKDVFYGTLLSEINKIWAAGKHVIFDVDVRGGLNIKKKFPDRTLALFVMPPSVEALAERISNRKTETPESIKKRIAKATYELEFAENFDYILLNDDLEIAKIEAYSVVADFLNEE
ncbi:MAG: guanylate kinase [Bacteroidota bacterium]